LAAGAHETRRLSYDWTRASEERCPYVGPGASRVFFLTASGTRLAPSRAEPITRHTVEYPTAPRRLNFGCGPCVTPGWINADRIVAPGVDVCCDLRSGLPLADRSLDYAVAIHVLQDIAWTNIPAAAAELHRVLKPGAVLRLGLPDLERAIAAYNRADAAYFYVPDSDAKSLGAKLVTQIIWYGSVRTPFTYEYAAEVLHGAGFRRVARCAYRETHTSHAEIASLDNRERESLFVEATK
jgi:SAM-dependent methyltransferase